MRKPENGSIPLTPGAVATQITQPVTESTSVLVLSPEARDELQTLQTRIQNYSVAEMVWQQLLTLEQKESVGDNLEEAWNKHNSTLGIVTHLWSCSATKALLRIAREFGSLPPAKIRWLERELGESSEIPPPTVTTSSPVWKKEEGKLYFQGKVIRSVPSVSKATRIVAIFDAFEDSGWPGHLRDPLGFGDPQTSREAVATLNEGLSAIRFESDGSGKGGVRWRLEGRATAARDA